MNNQMEKAFEIIEKINAAGGTAHVVGGALRDALLNREIGDVDIATSLEPMQIIDLFEKVIPVGIEHGTVLVRYRSESFEVTTYRKEEGYEDYRHPDKVAFIRSIEEDLARRDFTINAMAMDHTKEVIDPFYGKQDLQNRVIRAVGDAEVRFKEDPLRMMRALRFCSQLKFTLEESTFQAITRLTHLLEHISIERIALEYEKLMAGKGYKKAIEICKDVGLYRYLPVFKEQPELIHHVPKAALKNFADVITFYCEYSSIFSVNDWVKQWKLSNQVKREAVQLSSAIEQFKKGEKQAWIVYKLPDPLISRLIEVGFALGYEINGEELTDEHRKLAIKDRKDLAFQAEDLLQVYKDQPKGPWIGKLLESIEYAVVTNQLPNHYQSIKEWIIEWNLPETD
ncbi:CCA tRNA nucleotidyltransferase [Halobacillus sp. Marseille-Q1614]|uniref:CCA tRNA nucleotidyltransferase n=1 Tax=Halobacillus sp. Marseille-Q1614 TaxID=2709134 RepID=UPI0015700A5B|nr:CCA tRNA nucleotidyltransferase [Halobacillus sp. Marseille-Q1614]